MNDKVSIVQIELKINETSVKLNVDEAKALFEQLNIMFGPKPICTYHYTYTQPSQIYYNPYQGQNCSGSGYASAVLVGGSNG